MVILEYQSKKIIVTINLLYRVITIKLISLLKKSVSHIIKKKLINTLKIRKIK